MKFIRHGFKTIAFLCVLCVIFAFVSNVTVNSGTHNFQMMATFPEEPAGSLDVVYIGPSTAFTLFEGPIAFKKHGITVRMFSSDAQPLVLREDFIRYARKKHPNSLYIISVDRYSTDISEEQTHWTTDFFPQSPEKYRMISKVSELSDFSPGQRLAIYLPFIQFHSRWNQLTKEDFHRESDGLKGAYHDPTFLTGTEDVTKSYHWSDERMELDEDSAAYWDGLLDYCDDVNLNALFIVPPQCSAPEKVEMMNSVSDLIEERGYPVLNLYPKIDDIGLDFKTDYYAPAHTNLHGALKATDYIAEYLTENYAFTDKRGDPAYESWDEAYYKYLEIIKPYLSEEELSLLP